MTLFPLVIIPLHLMKWDSLVGDVRVVRAWLVMGWGKLGDVKTGVSVSRLWLPGDGLLLAGVSSIFDGERLGFHLACGSSASSPGSIIFDSTGRVPSVPVPCVVPSIRRGLYLILLCCVDTFIEGPKPPAVHL